MSDLRAASDNSSIVSTRQLRTTAYCLRYMPVCKRGEILKSALDVASCARAVEGLAPDLLCDGHEQQLWADFPFISGYLKFQLPGLENPHLRNQNRPISSNPRFKGDQ